jgi:choice-of-anchor B domain-containing protein
MRTSLILSLVFLGLVWSGEVAAQSTPFGERAQQKGFARVLDVEGPLVFAGEPENTHTPGRVYVFNRETDSTWAESDYLEAQDGAVGDQFGAALDADGERLLVGAPAANAAYLLQQSKNGWTQVARLTSPDSTVGFGRSVALTETHLVVGSQTTVTTTSTDTTAAAAVHVFEQDPETGWRESVVLRSSQLPEGAGFGESVAVQGTHLLVSAPRRNGGSVVAFRADSTWTEVQTLSADELSSSARFGSSLAWTGDGQVVIGAPRAYDATGVAYTFRYNASAEAWQRDGRLFPFDGATRQYFGAALAHDGTDVWVGAPGLQSQRGALYRFAWRDSTWADVTRIAHDRKRAGMGLGASLAAGDQVVATGLPGDDHRSGTMALYSLATNDWTRDGPIAPTTGRVFSVLTGERRSCADGAVEAFSCDGIDLQSFLPIRAIGGERGIELNDIWGWTDPQTGTEYALVGRTDGTAFVDVSDPANPVYVGELPLTDGARVNSWRDVKVYENYAFVVADNAGQHGMQIFDLTQLRDVEADAQPATFEATAVYDKINSAHNVVINEESGYAYIVGGSGGGKTCGGGLHMVNVQDPLNPTFEGCFADRSTGRSGTGYSHDAQCVMYDGPDEQYQGREICIGSNETAISVADVTEKDSAKAIATASYPDHAYVHQGWFTEDQQYFYQNDELDELQGKANRTRTLIWDMTDLDNPVLVDQLLLPEKSTDHNLYVKGDRMYQANYKSGLRILDISDRTAPKEIAHFDTQPYGDNSPGFQGAWSTYPYFESGVIIVSSIGEGLFVLTPSKLEL